MADDMMIAQLKTWMEQKYITTPSLVIGQTHLKILVAVST